MVLWLITCERLRMVHVNLMGMRYLPWSNCQLTAEHPIRIVITTSGKVATCISSAIFRTLPQNEVKGTEWGNDSTNCLLLKLNNTDPALITKGAWVPKLWMHETRIQTNTLGIDTSHQSLLFHCREQSSSFPGTTRYMFSYVVAHRSLHTLYSNRIFPSRNGTYAWV